MPFSKLVLVFATLLACEGKRAVDDAVAPTTPPQASSVDTTTPPREAFSNNTDPPPRPPPPAGIKVLTRDAVALALSGDGRLLAGGNLAGQALLWDLERGRFVWSDPTPEGNRLWRVVFARAANLYMAGSYHEPDRPWRVWSADALEKKAELGEASWLGIDAALSDDGARALTLSSSRDGAAQKLELWELAPAPKALAALALTRAVRGAVALDERGERFAVADELGGVRVMALAVKDGEPYSEIFRTEAHVGTTEDTRVSRLAFGPGAPGETVLYGTIGAQLMTWQLGAGMTSSTLVIGEAAGKSPDPIRGLHVRRDPGAAAAVLVAVTRPIDGGLRLWGTDGKLVATMDTGCRCETHALAVTSDIAACGCVEASELRWGKITRVPPE